MVRQADVVLEGFRPGASKRLGIDYDTVKGLNPRVIYAAISGYGQDAALRYGVGHDLNYLAASGVLHLTGDPGSVPAAPGAPFADGIAGLSAALNIVAALWRRTQNGDGCFLDIAIVDGPAFLMSMEYDYFRQTGDERQRGDTHLCSGYPWYHVFETADGRYLSVAAVEPHFFARLCHLLGRPDLATQQFVDGVERRALFQTFGAIFKSKSLNEWLEVLHGEDVCVAPVLTPGEATRGLHPLSDAGDATARGRSLIRLEASVASLPRETAATLASFGFAEEEVRALQEQGSIG
jgi:crotonobetainyl-CoA:carnitine CoA-transferase CaiB-like acyl-CoA transferase